MVTLFAVVPECRDAEVLDSVMFVNTLGVNVTFAPSSTLTYPPFSTISVAVPPLETTM